MKAEVDKPYGPRHRFGLFLGPILFVAVLVTLEGCLGREACRVAAVAVLMATWWICESIPLAATSLIPLAAFPLMKIVPAREVAASYASPEIYLFMGGFFIAVAMQRWDLHRRIALWIVHIVGVKGDRIILGFMVSTAFLSMWISNTAATMMMLPIGVAVIMTLEAHARSSETFGSFRIVLMLSIAYAANIGGIGTLIGTPPNIVFAAQVRSLFPEAGEISFVRWMSVGLPLVIVFIPLTWIFLTKIVFRGAHIDIGTGGSEVISEQRSKLGRITTGEKRTLIVFVLTVLAWITRGDIRLGSVTLYGWASVMSLGEYIHDSTIAIAAAIALFVLPVDWKRGIFVLNWKAAREIPWGILILFGGGIALGRGFSQSGLAARIAGGMDLASAAPLVLIVILIALLVTFLTEVTSNTAIATIFLPILAATAVGLGLHPFLMMIPATISASCAFMLPVATPPNAIVFSSGFVPMTGMVRAGIFMNLIGVVLVTLVLYLLVIPIFGISLTQLPAWVG